MLQEGRHRGQASIVKYRIPVAFSPYYIHISVQQEEETSFYIPMTLTYQFPEFQFPNLYGRRTGRDEKFIGRSDANVLVRRRDTRNQRARPRPLYVQTEKKPIDRFNK